jgi:hypothetical protein
MQEAGNLKEYAYQMGEGHFMPDVGQGTAYQ